jgi:DNA-binding transcriptional ArsR family regulator
LALLFILFVSSEADADPSVQPVQATLQSIESSQPDQSRERDSEMGLEMDYAAFDFMLSDFDYQDWEMTSTREVEPPSINSGLDVSVVNSAVLDRPVVKPFLDDTSVLPGGTIDGSEYAYYDNLLSWTEMIIDSSSTGSSVEVIRTPPSDYSDRSLRDYRYLESVMDALVTDEVKPVWNVEKFRPEPIEARIKEDPLSSSTSPLGNTRGSPAKYATQLQKEPKSHVTNELKLNLLRPPPEIGLAFFSRIMDPLENGSVRGEILEFIRANPGEHMSKIRRKLKLSSSSMVHHLRILESRELVLVHKDGKYTRYFANENGYRSSIDGEYKSIFSALKNENSRAIVSFLISNPFSTLSDVAGTMKVNTSTVHWHCERLVDSSIISKVKDGKNVRYFVEDIDVVQKVIALLDA